MKLGSRHFGGLIGVLLIAGFILAAYLGAFGYSIEDSLSASETRMTASLNNQNLDGSQCKEKWTR